MKVTALQSTHKALGAKMVPFAGYNMPVQYEGVNAEHETVRNNLGVFDVSHMGEFLIEGPNALNLIQSVSSNDASKLTVGKAQYSCLPNEQGGIVDDLIIYKVKDGYNLYTDFSKKIILTNGNIKNFIKFLRNEYAVSFVVTPDGSYSTYGICGTERCKGGMTTVLKWCKSDTGQKCYVFAQRKKQQTHSLIR